MKSIFGRQPAYDKAKEQSQSFRRLARDGDLNYTHLVNAVNGRCRPNDEVRQRLPHLLNARIWELFTPEVLERPFRKPVEK